MLGVINVGFCDLAFGEWKKTSSRNNQNVQDFNFSGT